MLKGKNTIKLLAALALLLVVFFVLRYTNDSSRSKSFRSELVTIEPDDVTRVEVLSSEDTIYLEKEGGKWMVNSSKPANGNTVSSLLKTLKTIEPSRIASRSEEKWKDFQVDNSGGVRVVAYDGSEKVLDIILGRFNVEGQRSFYSYVRLADEKDTYVAQNFMRMSVSTDWESYRNDAVLSLNPDSVSNISFNYADSAFSISKSEDGWKMGEMEVDSASTAQYLKGLRTVASSNFAENDGSGPLFDVVYTMADGTAFKVGHHGSGKISSTQNPEEFWQDSTVVGKLFKGKNSFLTGEN